MTNRLLTTVVLIFLLAMTGCATPTKMALINDSDTVLQKGNPIFLMTVDIKNTYKPSHQPRLLVVNIEKSTVNGSEDRINFTMDDKAKNESDDPAVGNSYLLRMELTPGGYVIRGFTSMSSSFPIHGFFFTPLHENFEAKGPGVFYLGHVSAIVRERKEDEFKAGASIPLIDQAVAGASGGTFDIEVSDQWEKDGPSFRKSFPVLASIDIQKAILPPFDREKAQKLWEAN
jgi:hypothetical protein